MVLWKLYASKVITRVWVAKLIRLNFLEHSVGVTLGDKSSSFARQVTQLGIVNHHHQFLIKELFKPINNLAPPIMDILFTSQVNIYNLRNSQHR